MTKLYKSIMDYWKGKDLTIPGKLRWIAGEDAEYPDPKDLLEIHIDLIDAIDPEVLSCCQDREIAEVILEYDVETKTFGFIVSDETGRDTLNSVAGLATLEEAIIAANKYIYSKTP